MPAVAKAQAAKVRWRLVSSFPRSLRVLFDNLDAFAARVGELTDGEFVIQTFAPGEIVGPLQVLDAVGEGTVQAGHTLSLYYTGKNKAYAFECGIPFGLTARQQSAWMLKGGGLELVRELMKKENVVPFPLGNTGAQMGGWFRKKIESLSDLNGLRMRVPGLGAEVLSKLGVVPQAIPASDIYTALERGTLDAVEWVGPHDDEVLGLHQIAKNYYFPGFWDCSAQNSLYVNSDAWESLPEKYKSAVEAASLETYARMLAEYDNENLAALQRLVAAGVELHAFPTEVLQAGYDAAMEIYKQESEANEDFKKIYDHYAAYKRNIQRWFRISEASYEFFAYSRI
jgi:TRAP-type mannitol/chloroaromatic compound transport system substrate-binding protein